MDTFFMSTVLDPVVAIIGILVPLGVAYAIVALQVRLPDEKLERLADHESRAGN